MTNEMRLKLEMRVVRKLVKDALALGYAVSVFDGEEWTVHKSKAFSAIIAALRTTDDDILLFRNAANEIVGKVLLIYGNEPYEVINDYSANPAMEALIAGANATANKIESMVS